MSGRGSTRSGKGWFSELCGGRGRFRGGELSDVTSPLSQILFITSSNGLSLCFRPIRLCRFRFSLFGRIFWHFKSSWQIERLLLIKLSLRRS